MSPSIFVSKNNTKIDSNEAEYKKIIFEHQNFIKKNFDYVGEDFTYEARSIYYKEKKSSRGIYGSATKEELKELKEEGIETKLFPWIKDNIN